MAGAATDSSLSTDYLVVGAGTSGMCFTDEVLRDPDAEVIIVDRRAAPGGHWLASYPFVRLHQASVFYGINRVPLGSGTVTQRGVETGFSERASGAEVLGHFDDVMQHRFIGSGRVRFLARHAWEGGTTIRSLMAGASHEVDVRRSVVDTTYSAPTIPATTDPPYDVADGVRSIDVAGLADEDDPAGGYVVVGGGKTATDAITWLLSVDVDPGSITWIRPRDSWMLNRRFLQPGAAAKTTLEGVVAHVEAVRDAPDADAAFLRLEDAGVALRTDADRTPTMMRGATLSEGEVEQLRSVENVVRMGHVRRIEKGRIVLDGGDVATSADAVHVHCAASGFPVVPTVPVWGPKTIVTQNIARISYSFSASLVGYVESTGRSTEEKNALCPASRFFTTPAGYLRTYLEGLRTEFGWTPDLSEWAASSRLNVLSDLADLGEDPEVAEMQGRFLAGAAAALQRLPELDGVV